MGHHFRQEFLPGHGFDTWRYGARTGWLAGRAVDQQAAHLSHGPLAVPPCLRNLGCDEALEEGAEKWRLLELGLRFDSQEMTGESGVRDVDLWRLDESLSEVIEVRREPEDLGFWRPTPSEFLNCQFQKLNRGKIRCPWAGAS